MDKARNGACHARACFRDGLDKQKVLELLRDMLLLSNPTALSPGIAALKPRNPKVELHRRNRTDHAQKSIVRDPENELGSTREACVASAAYPRIGISEAL